MGKKARGARESHSFHCEGLPTKHAKRAKGEEAPSPVLLACVLKSWVLSLRFQRQGFIAEKQERNKARNGLEHAMPFVGAWVHCSAPSKVVKNLV
jgi:hypothetical protein